MKKERVSIKAVKVKLNIPCEAKGCRGRINIECSAKIVKTYEGRSLKTSVLGVQSIPKKRCSVCKKVNHLESFEIDFAEPIRT